MVERNNVRDHAELQSHQSFPVFRTVGEKSKSRLEKLLSVSSDVRAGEGVNALLLALNVFLLLAAYYLLKPVREALILSESGAEVKSYSSAGQALLLLGIVPFYGWVASKVNRIRLLTGLTLFFVFNLVLFWIGGQKGLRLGVIFYIWLGIYNLFTVSQFWAFANDIYTEAQGRRLFPLVGVGMSLGALAGATVATPLVALAGLGPYTFMLIAAAILVICLGLTWVVDARTKRSSSPEAAKEAGRPLGKEGGFRLVLRDRYLLWIAVLIVLLNVVNTIGEYTLSKLVVAEASASGDAVHFINEFYAQFYMATNLLGLLLQALAASRVIRYAGVRGALFVLPVLALVSYSVLALVPALMVVRWTKVLENGTDYSIMNTVRQALWLPTSREAKYKAKAAIDTFCHRGGDVLQAAIVFAGTSLGAGIAGFAWLNVALTAVWLGAAYRIFVEHRKLTA
ncbi:MAG: NTP/NDP exchange transporter [Bryobacteraceae bacterium]